MSAGSVFLTKELGTTHVADRYRILADMLRIRLGWKVICDNALNVADIEGNTLLTIKTPQCSRLESVEAICSVPDSVRVVGLFADTHYSFGSDLSKKLEYVAAASRVFDRCDVILSSYGHPFMCRWVEFTDKTYHFPQFYAPEARYRELPYNENPDKVCLVSGFRARKVYRLREVAYQLGPDLVKTLEHPGYASVQQRPTGVGRLTGQHVRSHAVRQEEHQRLMEHLKKGGEWKNPFRTGDDFATELNAHFCALSDCSVYGYVVGKYVEIPAAGSLLVANYTPDLDTLGFVDGVNYVRVSPETVEQKLKDILSNPDEYEGVRKRGREFVLEQFGVENRFEQLRGILA